MRRELFDPTDLTYLVGRTFHPPVQGSLCGGNRVAGRSPLPASISAFISDAPTGKKLSSCDTVANMNNLLASSIEHFRAKSAQRGDPSRQELGLTARQLAAGSLVFNDLKADVKASSRSTRRISKQRSPASKSGGAHVVYTACRSAQSIPRRRCCCPAKI